MNALPLLTSFPFPSPSLQNTSDSSQTTLPGSAQSTPHLPPPRPLPRSDTPDASPRNAPCTPSTPHPFSLSPYLHLPLLRERHNIPDRFFLHAHRPQQLLQRALLHVHERTPVALRPRRPHLHHRRARQRVQRHSSALQAVQIPDVVRVLPRELLHRQLRRELLLPERQRALHAQTDPPQEPAQLLAAVVEEMVRAAEMQVHRAHAQRERPTRQLGVTPTREKNRGDRLYGDFRGGGGLVAD